MAKAAHDPIQVEVIIRASVYVPVAGKTLADALEAAKQLGVGDVATFNGDVMDANISIAGVYDSKVSRKVDA